MLSSELKFLLECMKTTKLYKFESNKLTIIEFFLKIPYFSNTLCESRIFSIPQGRCFDIFDLGHKLLEITTEAMESAELVVAIKKSNEKKKRNLKFLLPPPPSAAPLFRPSADAKTCGFIVQDDRFLLRFAALPLEFGHKIKKVEIWKCFRNWITRIIYFGMWKNENKKKWWIYSKFIDRTTLSRRVAYFVWLPNLAKPAFWFGSTEFQRRNFENVESEWKNVRWHFGGLKIGGNEK